MINNSVNQSRMPSPPIVALHDPVEYFQYLFAFAITCRGQSMGKRVLHVVLYPCTNRGELGWAVQALNDELGWMRQPPPPPTALCPTRARNCPQVIMNLQ